MNNQISEITKIEVGQIRKLDGIQGIANPRLVVIAETDSKDATCLVFLLNNMVEAAIPRDLCLSSIETGSSFDLVLMTEYFSRADQARVVKNKVLGNLKPAVLARIRKTVFDNPFGELPDSIQSQGIKIGSYPVQKYDSVWVFRGNEFDNFKALTFHRNTISIDFAHTFYELHRDDLSAYDDPDAPIDALRFQSLSMSMVMEAA
jgi:hypothetical protein